MELINHKNLIGLPVYTKSGQYLGKVSGFDFDPCNHIIMKYYIRSSSLIKKILQPELIISYKEVVSLTKEKMVVEDIVEKIKEPVIVPLSTNS